MNTDSFSLNGYISVLLWVIVPTLWVIYGFTGPRRWLCPIAFVLAIMAFFFAKDNSKNYVNLIQLDRSEEIAAQLAREEASLKALKESRGNDLSNVRFAEDSATDSLDRAGMEQEDLKYMDSMIQKDTPDWKKSKKARTAGGVDNGSIESAVGGGNAINAADSETFDGMQEEVPVIMVEEDLAMANRLDSLNLKIIRLIIIVGLIMVIYDYLKRANIQGKESFPLPLPSAWINGLTPLATIVESAQPVELSKLAKRGDSFVYFTDEKQLADAVPQSFSCDPIGKKKMDVIRTDHELGPIDNNFIFETVWFGKSSFVVDTATRSNQLLETFLNLLAKRKQTRARVNQSVHLVWDLSTPIPEAQKERLALLAKVTGFSLILNPRK